MQITVAPTLLRTLRGFGATILVAAILSGCHVYKINVQQGNYLDETAIEQVEPGMTRRQVKFLLGTPLVEDTFKTDRWDYIYYFRSGKTGKSITRRLVVHFDGDNVRELERVN